MSFMNGKKFLNVEEATDILLNHDFSDAQLVMLPPPGGDDVLTDEEDINDEHVLEDPYAAPRDVVGEVEVHLKSTEDLEVDYQLHVNTTEEQDDNRLDDEESDVDDEGVGDASNEDISFTIDNPSRSGKRLIGRRKCSHRRRTIVAISFSKLHGLRRLHNIWFQFKVARRRYGRGRNILFR